MIARFVSWSNTIFKPGMEVNLPDSYPDTKGIITEEEPFWTGSDSLLLQVKVGDHLCSVWTHTLLENSQKTSASWRRRINK
jgi:hypothetical protein